MRHSMCCPIQLVAACCLMVALACDQRPDSAQEAQELPELVVITPHNAEIRDAFAGRFSVWHEKNYKHPVSIRWLYRGTVDAQRYICDHFEREAGSGVRQIGVDAFFGGGLPIHRDIAARGYAQAVKVPEAVLGSIPKELNGQPLYDPDGMWYGTAISGYGMLFNSAAARERNLPTPKDWTDLALPAYRGWVAAADPALSGSTAECLILVLLERGWDEGWGTVLGIVANCNGLLPSSGAISPNVACGVAVAGLQAEFVGRMAVAESQGTLEYIHASSGMAMTPDPVTVLQGAQHLDAATHFVEFLLSIEGQSLWALPPDQGGPVSREPLYRYPIRPDIYQRYGDKLVVKGNPFAEQKDARVDPAAEAAYTRLLPHLVAAASGKNHFVLQAAWAKAQSQGENSPAVAALRKVPFGREQAFALAEECSKSPKRAAELQAEWSRLFRQKYDAVLGRPATTGMATAGR